MTPPSKTKTYSRRYDKLRRLGYHMQVDGTVTRRKIAALQAIGYSLTEIGERMGRAQQSVSETFHSSAPIHRTTEKEVAALYAALHLKPNQWPYAERTRARARRLGYAPPLSYDDINDPSEDPKGVRR